MIPSGDPPRSGKTRGQAGRMVALVFLLLAVVLAIWKYRPAAPVQRFIVTAGQTTHQIALNLRTQGLVSHSSLFLIWTQLGPGHGAIRPGVYEISPSLSSFSILRTLQHGPPRVKITFPEGWTAKQMAQHLQIKGIASAAEFIAEVDRGKREGFLFPDTYFFELALPPSVLISRMVRRFHEAEPRDMLAQAKALHLTYQQIVVLASIVEREARVPQERPIIAGVFLNRLRKHSRLESCATIEYALGARKPQLSYKDLQIDSPYNTYRHAGLPPGPICNPGAAALQAAAHPAATQMMFFVADGHGMHRFSKDYKNHLAVQGYK